MKKMIFLIIAAVVILNSCSRSSSPSSVIQSSDANLITQVSIEEILQNQNLIPLRQSNQILLVDPQKDTFAPIYQFNEGEISTTNKFTDYVLSPSQNWLVWYTSTKGIMALNIPKQQLLILEPPHEWFSRHPYLEFSQAHDHLYYISSEGHQLNRINLENQNSEHFTIPFPFGHEFRVAPDETKILYITGFDPNPKRPRFMFAQIPHDNEKSFSTETELTDRYLVTWNQDSSGVITIKDQQLVQFSYETRLPQVILDVAPGSIQDLKKVDNLLYALDNQGYWHVLDGNSNYKEIARTPTSIVSELRSPKFIPWANQQFLLTETISNDDLIYSRLWVSNFRGNKHMLITQFAESKLVNPALP